MEETQTTGSIKTSTATKLKLAQDSTEYNERDPIYRILFSSNEEIKNFRIQRETQREERIEQEIEKEASNQEYAKNRYNTLIITAIAAIVLCLLSVLAQVWINQK